MDLRQELNNCLDEGYSNTRGIIRPSLSRNDLLDVIVDKVEDWRKIKKAENLEADRLKAKELKDKELKELKQAIKPKGRPKGSKNK